MSGLIATMPITSLIVLIWLATDNPGDTKLITSYTRGVLWGILPTIAFFAVTYYCLRKGNELPLALAAGSVCWLVGALLHQWALK